MAIGGWSIQNFAKQNLIKTNHQSLNH